MYDDVEGTLIKLREGCCNIYQIKVNFLFKKWGNPPPPPPFYSSGVRISKRANLGH